MRKCSFAVAIRTCRSPRCGMGCSCCLSCPWKVNPSPISIASAWAMPMPVTMRQAQVKQAASAVGLTIDFSRIETMPNTADAHRLFERVSARGNATQREMLLERLFAAYFRKGENLGCRETLLAIARSCGVDADSVLDCLKGDATPFAGSPECDQWRTELSVRPPLDRDRGTTRAGAARGHERSAQGK